MAIPQLHQIVHELRERHKGSLEASPGLAVQVVGIFEAVNWNLRALRLAERKEPIVVPQLVLDGSKLVSEGDTNKSELVLAKENGRGGLFARARTGVTV
jgi:hypothetical protein